MFIPVKTVLVIYNVFLDSVGSPLWLIMSRVFRYHVNTDLFTLSHAVNHQSLIQTELFADLFNTFIIHEAGIIITAHIF